MLLPDGAAGWLAGVPYIRLAVVFLSASLLSIAAAQQVECELDVFAIGHKVSDPAELSSWLKKKRSAVLIGFSSSSCRGCCIFEKVYNESSQLWPKDIELLRVDVDDHRMKGVASRYKVEGIPAVVLVHQRKQTLLQEEHSMASIAALIDSAKHTLPGIRAGATLASWLDVASHFQEAGKESEAMRGVSRRIYIRVLALSQQNEDENLEDVSTAALTFAARPLSMRFAHASGTAAVSQASALLKAHSCVAAAKKGDILIALALFDGEHVASSRISTSAAAADIIPVLGSQKRQSVFNVSAVTTDRAAATAGILPRVMCRPLDVYDGMSVQQWVLTASLPDVGRFDQGTSWLYEQTRQPFLMLFADLQHKELPAWLRLLAQASMKHGAKQHAKGLWFVYADGIAHADRMSTLGLSPDPGRLPALSFNYVDDRHLLWQPAKEVYEGGSAVLTSTVIEGLVHRYLHGDGAELVEEPASEALPVPKRDQSQGERRKVPDLDTLSLEDRLRFVKAVTQENFREVVLDAASDVLVYFYTSKGSQAERATDAAIFINRCAERFQELRIKTVKIAKMDVSRFSVPTQVQLLRVPSILLFPAFAKDPPHLHFEGEVNVQRLMWWVEDHASRPFKLRALPHLDDIEVREYWSQKSELSAERQEEVARVNERRTGKREL
mmetsp:Transcript_22557/g.41530  ORF Transcript_22557/g.41530 Transcript_22557/m.41530 type:complete len:668 (+) Transcript_22557:103-2106(+)